MKKHGEPIGHWLTRLPVSFSSVKLRRSVRDFRSRVAN